jgi:hypothetical protein
MGRTVGCETDWTVEFVDRVTGQVADVGMFASASGAWKLDTITQATVVIPKSDCCAPGMALVRPWRYTMTVKRAGQVVFQGPVTTRRERRDSMTYTAADLLGWSRVRWMGGAGSFTGTSAEIVGYVLNRTLSNPDDPIQWQSRIEQTSDTRTVSWGQTAVGWDVLRQVLDTSLDLYAVGDTIYSVPANRDAPLELSEQHMSNDFESFENGWEFGTRSVAGSGDVVATAGGVDPYWGLVDRTLGNATANTSETPQAVADDLLLEARGAGMLLLPGSSGNLVPGAPFDLFDLMPGKLFTIAPSQRCVPLTSTFESVDTAWAIDSKRSEAIATTLREIL